MNSATYPETISSANGIDDLLGLGGAGIARALYDGQKTDLALVLGRLRAAPLVPADRAAAAALLHNIAGTAAYFHDDALGGMASALEQPLRDAPGGSAVSACCDALLRLIEAR